jgi:hypothetical protein
MGVYKFIISNQDPVCGSSYEQTITTSGCTTFLLKLNTLSTSEGPFNIYIDTINSTPIYTNVSRSQLLIGVQYSLECPTPSATPPSTPCVTRTPTITPTPTLTSGLPQTPTPTISSTPSITPSITPTISVTKTVTPSITPTISITPSLTSSITPSLTPSITPSLPILYAYLFIEPVNLNTQFNGWMQSRSSSFRGFSNGIAPSINQITYSQQLNSYLSFSGWGGNAPSVRSSNISRTSGGVDSYGNLIQAYLFKTHEVPADLVSGYSWFTWVISTNGTNNDVITNIGVNDYGDPNSLTPVGVNSVYSNMTVQYTGSTIPQGNYRVYTTFNNTNFRLLNTNNIYFKGNSLTIAPSPTPSTSS